MFYSKKVFSAVLAALTIINSSVPVTAQNNILFSGGNAAGQAVTEGEAVGGYTSDGTALPDEAASAESYGTSASETDSGAGGSAVVPSDMSGGTQTADESAAEASATEASAEAADLSDASVPSDESSTVTESETPPVPDDSSTALEAEGLVPDDSSVSELVADPAAEEAIGAAAVAEGLYYICIKESSPCMMSIKNNASGDKVNIQVGSYAASNVRMFYIESTGDGYYYIRSLHTNKYLTVGAKNNVQQWALKADGKGQKWLITKNADGSYQFLTADKKYKLSAASNTSGANISVNAKTTGIKSWTLKPAKPIISGGMVSYTYEKSVEKAADGTVIPPTVTISLYGETLAEGVDYTVTSTIESKSGTLTLRGIGKYAGSKKLTYTIYTYPLSDGCYHIYANSSSLKPMFSIRGNSDGNMANLQLGSYAASNVRLFALERAGEGYYYIRNVHTGKYLTAEGDGENANVCQFTLRNTAAQQWKLNFYGHTYRIVNRSSGKFLIAPKAKAGSNLQLYSKQMYQYAWTIVPAKMYLSGGMVQYDYKEYALYDAETGEYSQPGVSVKLYGTTLQEGVDYTTSYSVNPDQGIGKIVVKGIGGYTGSKTLTYVLYQTAEESYPQLPVNIETYQSDYRFEWTFRLDKTSTKLYLTREGYHASQTDVSSCAMCDMGARKLYIMRGYRTFAMDDMKELASVSLGSITPKAGETYMFSMEKFDTFGMTATLTELSTGNTATVTDRSIYSGRGWGKTKTHVSGSATEISLEGFSTKPGDGILAIMGDSYTEGTTLRDSYTMRFATLLDNEFGRSVMITSKGGATSAQGLKWLNEYLKDIAKPRYMIVEFGMNDTNFNTWQNNMTSIIGILESNGITPILATVPPVNAKTDAINAVHRNMSKWVMNSGFMYLDFEYVMTVSHDRVTPDSSKLLSDGLHPTARAHKQTVDLFMKKYGDNLSN